MVRTSFSSSCSICCAEARGRSTFTPLWIKGAVTMKMIKSTSITSTSGVTLMSVIARCPGVFSEVKAISAPLCRLWNALDPAPAAAPPEGRSLPPGPPNSGGSVRRSRRLLEYVAFNDVQEIGAEVAHLVVEHADARVEGVVGHQRGDGGEEAHRGGDQRLGDGPRH